MATRNSQHPPITPLFPISQAWIIRSIVFFLFLSLLTAGLYRTKLLLLQKEYDLVEDKYVRVRSELGREATQYLLDQSYNQDADR